MLFLQDRIRGYLNRVKEIQDKKKAPKLDKAATKRFVRSALWQKAHQKAKEGGASQGEYFPPESQNNRTSVRSQFLSAHAAASARVFLHKLHHLSRLQAVHASKVTARACFSRFRNESYLFNFKSEENCERFEVCKS